jgi:RNA polymerase sigma factor (sigma-70 family)
MPPGQLQPVIRQIRRLAGDPLAESDDAFLLDQFAARRDERAFEALVRRHGRLVREVCRHVLSSEEDAEDAFQATFLVLARKAGAIRKRQSLASWLHGVALRASWNARKSAMRQRQRATAVAAGQKPGFSEKPGFYVEQPVTEAALREVQAILDEEVQRLPEKLRAPFVLCCLEAKSKAEAARVLSWKEGTVSGRLAQARERLRDRLTRRGVSLSAALCALAVTGEATAALTAAVTATTQAAIRFLASGCEGSSAILASHALQGMAGGKIKAMILVMLSLLAASAISYQLPAVGGRPKDEVKQRADEPKAESPKPKADLHGDSLPAGAVARLGIRRLCGPMDPMWAAYSPDGRKLATQSFYGVTVWDAVTGMLLVERMDYRVVVNGVVVNGIGWQADGTGVAIVRLPDASYFVSAFTDSAEKLPTPPRAAEPPGRPGPDGLHPLALSTDATRLAVVQNPDGEQFTIDILPAMLGRTVASLKPERTLGPFPGPCREIRYTAGGLVYLTGPWKDKGDWSIALIDPEKNVVTKTTSIPPPAYCVWRHMLSLSVDARFAAIPTRAKRATNEHEGTIRVWDLAAGKELWKLPFPQCGYGIGHAFTPDGKRLITSTDKTFFQVWDLATGKETAKSPPPGGAFPEREASAVAISPDGKRFATARRDGRVDFWDTATGKAINPLATHRGVIDAVAVSPDGKLAATLGHDHSVRVWELATGKPGCVIPAPMDQEPKSRFGSERRLAFTPDGRGLLFTAGSQLALANPASGKRLDLPGGMRGRKGVVGGFSANGKSLATVADDVVTLWEWPAGTVMLTVTIPLGPEKPLSPKDSPETATVRSAAVSADGRFLFTNSVRWSAIPASGGMHNANDVWDARNGKHLHRLATPKIEYPSAAFAPDSHVMYLGGHGLDDARTGRKQADALTTWDPTTGKLVRRFADPAPAEAPRLERFGRTVSSVAVAPDGRLLAGTEGPFSSDSSVGLYETLTGRVIQKLPGHARTVTGLAFSPDGRRLVSVSDDQTGLVWDVTLPALSAKTADKGLAVAWDRLAAPDPGLGYAGIATLAAAPAEALPLLRAKLRPAPVPTDADLDRLVGQLDAEAFADREKASAELEQFGPNAVAGVKDRLTRVASEEIRKRLTRFLARYDGPDPSPYQVRCVRGVGVLEAIGSAEAKQLLESLAKGAPEANLTREAKAALERLARR